MVRALEQLRDQVELRESLVSCVVLLATCYERLLTLRTAQLFPCEYRHKLVKVNVVGCRAARAIDGRRSGQPMSQVLNENRNERVEG